MNVPTAGRLEKESEHQPMDMDGKNPQFKNDFSESIDAQKELKRAHEQNIKETGEEEEKYKALQPFSGYFLNIWRKPKPETKKENSDLKYYTLMPLRGIWRTIYVFGVCSLVAPFGAIHHFSKYVQEMDHSDEKIKNRAWEHLTAAGVDVKAFVEGLVLTALAVSIAVGSGFAFLQSMTAFSLVGVGVGAAILACSSPVAGYVFFPKIMKEKYLTETYLKTKHEKEMAQSRLDEATRNLELEKTSYAKAKAKKEECERKVKLQITLLDIGNERSKRQNVQEENVRLVEERVNLCKENNLMRDALRALASSLSVVTDLSAKSKGSLKNAVTTLVDLKLFLGIRETEVDNLEQIRK